MIVGGCALPFHWAPRCTGHIDILVRPDNENTKRIMNALDEFRFGAVGLEILDFMYENKVVQLRVPPARIDIITSISGVIWEDAFS